MNVPFLNLKPQHDQIKKEVFAKLEELYDRTEFAYGKTSKEFEAEFAQYNQTSYASAIDNGTTAVELSLRAAGIGSGDEVLTVANTFIATVAGIHFVGAKPIFVEVDPFTWNIDVTKIEEKITPKTKAILPVHLYGQPADMLKIKAIAQKHKLILIGDSAQSIGSMINENGLWKPTSCFADLSSFSFYAGKNLGACGEAGMITTNNLEWLEYINMFRDHGSKEKYIHEMVGRNNRIDGFQSAILSIKLKYIERWNEKRRQVASWYFQELAGVSQIQLPHCPSHILPVYHLFVVLVDQREAFQNYLAEKGIGTAFHYKIPVHLQRAFSYLEHKKGELPITESIVEKNISLPMFPEITQEDVQYISKTIKCYFERR